MLYKRKDIKATDISESAGDDNVVINLELENSDNTEKLVEKTCNVAEHDEEPRFSLSYFHN